MIDLTFLSHYAPVWLLVIMTVLIFGALTLLKIPGHPFVMVITSLLISFLFVSSTSATNFLINIIPILTVLMVIGFVLVLSLVLLTKDIATFTKPLAWIIFILGILFVLGSAFNSFPTLNHILPNTSDSGLSEGVEQLKDFIYSPNFRDGIIFVVSIVLVGFFLLKK
jgi:predicted transglutaminase-like protease